MWWSCTQYCVIVSCGLMPRDNRCMYMAHVGFYVCCSDCLGSVVTFVVYRPLLKIVGFSLGVLKYVGCTVLCLYSEAWRCMRLYMGSVSSCRCCMFVSGVHIVAVLNVASCMTCSLLMLVEDTRGDHMEET